MLGQAPPAVLSVQVHPKVRGRTVRALAQTPSVQPWGPWGVHEGTRDFVRDRTARPKSRSSSTVLPPDNTRSISDAHTCCVSARQHAAVDEQCAVRGSVIERITKERRCDLSAEENP
jgi:hypothetical protein